MLDTAKNLTNIANRQNAVKQMKNLEILGILERQGQVAIPSYALKLVPKKRGCRPATHPPAPSSDSNPN